MEVSRRYEHYYHRKESSLTITIVHINYNSRIWLHRSKSPIDANAPGRRTNNIPNPNLAGSNMDSTFPGSSTNIQHSCLSRWDVINLETQS